MASGLACTYIYTYAFLVFVCCCGAVGCLDVVRCLRIYKVDFGCRVLGVELGCSRINPSCPPIQLRIRVDNAGTYSLPKLMLADPTCGDVGLFVVAE